MWKGTLSPSNIEQHSSALPPLIPEDNKIPNMPDITLEDDLLEPEDDLANIREP